MAKRPDDGPAVAKFDAAADGKKNKKPAARGGKSRLLLIGGALALLLASGGGYWFLLKPKSEMQMAGAKSEPKKQSAFLDLPELTINLVTGPQERQQFFKVKIALEVTEPRLIQEIQLVLPRVLDLFNVYLREMRPSDIEGSAAFYRLKEELMRRVNVAIYPAKVDGVLFKEVLVQ